MSLLHQLQELIMAYNLPEPDYSAPLPSGGHALLAYWDERMAVVDKPTQAAGWRLFPCDPADPESLEEAVKHLAEALGYLSPEEETPDTPATADAAPQEPTLTDQQRKAVAHSGGPARILAGAGTGKTRVIVSRFHHLVAEGVKPERILALTFSREAARAMREAILPGLAAATRLWVLTFHSFCLKVLEGEGQTDLRLVKEEEERRALMAGVCEGQSWQHYTGGRQQRLVDDALTLIGHAKDYLLTPDELARYAAAFGQAQLADLAEAYRLYQAQLERQGGAEFADFISRAVALLEADPAVAARWQGRFDHILVDEFQDTNLAQFRVLQILTQPHGNLVVVGDDDQAIYRFRGATDRFLIHWERYYPDARTYKVEENFRCPAPVLEAANALIRRNPGRVAKELFTTTRVEGFPPVRHWEAKNEREEAEAIATEIARRLPDARPGDFAILCRSLRRMGGELSQALERRGIPYRMVGEELSHPLVDETLALLRLTEGVTPAATPGATQADLVKIMARRLDPPALHQALRDGTLAPDDELQAWLESHRGLPLPELVYQALCFLGHLRITLSPTTADLARLSAARALQERAATATDLEELARPGDARQVPGDAVNLMTIHAAKGLEFPVVFVAGLGEGIFPVAVQSAPVFYTAEAIRTWVDQGESTAPDQGERLQQHIREERRLAYVALTRAKQELILTRARQYSGEPVEPSRFLAEMGAPPAQEVGGSDPLPDARTYLVQVAAGEEPGDPNRVTAAVRLMQADPKAVPLRRQEEPIPFTGRESLRLSATALETYRTCPRRYYYAQVLRLEEESIAFSFGQSVHATLEQYHRALQSGAQPTWSEVESWWQERLDPADCETQGQYQQLLARGQRFLERYYRWSQGHWRRILQVEDRFEVPYIDGKGRMHQLVGQYDLVAETADGAVEIVDFKTGHRKGATTVNKRPTKNSANNADRRLQLGLYYLAYFGGEVDPTARVRYIFLRHVNDKLPNGLLPDFDESEQAIGCPHTAPSLALIREQVDQIIDAILANRFDRTSDPKPCEYCSFGQLCEVSPHDWF